MPGTRLPALDAIRAAALLLGIALHASLSFVPGIGTELWPMSDIHKSTVMSVTMFVIHIFRMSVFFFVAGLLARALLERRGVPLSGATVQGVSRCHWSSAGSFAFP